MALADKYAGLENLEARESDGSGNTAGGEVGDVYARITDAQYETNASDSASGHLSGTRTTGWCCRWSRIDTSNPDPIQCAFVGTMPQAEAISTAVMDLAPGDQNHPSSLAVNELFDFFGQVLTHDVAEASTATPATHTDAHRRPAVPVRPHAGRDRRRRRAPADQRGDRASST